MKKNTKIACSCFVAGMFIMIALGCMSQEPLYGGYGGYGYGGYGYGGYNSYPTNTSYSTGGSTSRQCPRCSGSGKCTTCKGTGRVYDWGPMSIVSEEKYDQKCGVCNGSGKCGVCDGKGTVG